jgi:CRP/FNR family cyclic AMP-dependent transcriptional regulator
LELRQAHEKERIIEEGTEVRAFYIVCDGVIHVRRLAQKREILLGRIGPGGFFGEINLFDPGVATASIYAMKNAKLAQISYGKFREFMKERPAAGYAITSAMVTEMARRLRQTGSRLVNMVYWSSAQATEPRRTDTI